MNTLVQDQAAIVEEVTSTRQLTALDRCSLSAAEAALVLVSVDGFELPFCGHHFNAARDGLVVQGAEVLVDNRKWKPEQVES